MVLASEIAKNISLDACYGGSKSSVWPATVYMALFAGDPADTGVELTSAGGYARVAITNDTTHWPAAAGGQKANALEVAFPASSAAWSATATHFALMSALTAGNKLDSALLTSPVAVTAAATTVVFPANSLTLVAA